MTGRTGEEKSNRNKTWETRVSRQVACSSRRFLSVSRVTPQQVHRRASGFGETLYRTVDCYCFYSFRVSKRARARLFHFIGSTSPDNPGSSLFFPMWPDWNLPYLVNATLENIVPSAPLRSGTCRTKRSGRESRDGNDSNEPTMT